MVELSIWQSFVVSKYNEKKGYFPAQSLHRAEHGRKKGRRMISAAAVIRNGRLSHPQIAGLPVIDDYR
jgi:hypothetical protein